jgi:hypothetical protein
MTKLMTLIALVAISNVATAADCLMAESKQPSYLTRIEHKSEQLKEHLPLEIEVLKNIQGIYQEIMKAQKEKNPLIAFEAAYSFTNIQTIISSAEDILKCLYASDKRMVSIGVGASPVMTQNIGILIEHLKKNHTDSCGLETLAQDLVAITADIPNPSIRVESHEDKGFDLDD